MFVFPWPSFNVVAASFLLFARRPRIPAWSKVAAVILGAASWVFVLLCASRTVPEQLAVNLLWPQVISWFLSCTLAAANIVLSGFRPDGGPPVG